MTEMKYLRLLNKIKQAEIEKRTGIQRWKISMAENGYFVFSAKEKEDICAVIGGDPKTLLEMHNIDQSNEEA